MEERSWKGEGEAIRVRKRRVRGEYLVRSRERGGGGIAWDSGQKRGGGACVERIGGSNKDEEEESAWRVLSTE